MVMRIMVLVALLGHSSVANSQYGVTYPVDINAMLTPPYGTCLTDYVGTNRFQCNVLMRDMHATGYKFRILMTVKDMASGRVMFSAQSDQHTVTPGKPVYMAETGVFSEFFKAGNILSSTAYRDGCLNEGAYNFVFQVVDDNDKRRIPISKECVFPARLQAGGAPLLISPFTGTNIDCNQTIVNFSWQMPVVTGEQTKYLIEICPTDEGGNGLHYLGSYTPSANGSGPSQGYIHATSYMPMYQLIETEGKKLVPNTTYFWRVSIIDEFGNVKPNSTSEIDSFTYCYTKELEPYVPLKEPLVKAINSELDTVHIDTVKTEDNATKATWFLDDVRFKYQSYALDIRKKSQDTWTTYHIKINEGDTEEKNYYGLSNLKYNEPYEARMQYLLITDNDTSYAPFSDTITFVVPNPMDTADCGEIMAIKDCNGEKGRILKKYDTLYANGTPVVLDSIIYKTGDSTVISGFGVVSFPILRNFKLKMSFNEVSVNCYGELVSGQVVSVYNESTGAIIDLNHSTGKGDGGGSQSTTERPDPTSYKDENEAKEKMQTGEYAKIDDFIYTKDKDGNVVALGKTLSIPAEKYTNNNTLDDDDVYCIFRNDTKDAPFIGFDADEHKYYRGRPTLGDHYTPTFSKQDGADFEYIIPYVASNPGRVVKLSATLEGRLTDEYDKESLKFIMPMSGGDYLDLNAKKEGDKFIVDFPGGKNPDTNSDVYAIVKKGEKYVNVGKINIETYAWRKQKVKFVPVVNDYGVDENAISETLNRIYGRFGITYEVSKDDRFESENINSEFLNNFSVSSGTFTKQSDDMKRLQYDYKAERGLEDSTAYIFLLKSAVDYPSIDGDMPQGQICGYIFMHSDNGTLSDGRLVAHELAHGIYRLDHVFEKAYGIPENSTDNLLDYNNGDQLAHFQWELIKNPGFAWALLESDEENMAIPPIPPCVYKSAASMVSSSVAGGLADYAINQVIGTDIDKEKSLKDCIGEGFSDNFTVANTIRTVAETCFSLDDYARYISMLFNAGSSASDYFDCRDEGGDFCHCLVKSVTNFLLSTMVDEVKKKLSERLSKKHPNLSSDKKKAVCEKLTSSMFDYFKLDSKIAAESVSAVAEGLFDGIMDGTDSKISGKIVEGCSEKLADWICKEAETPKVENIRIEIDKDKILHVYLYTKIKDNTQLNKTRAVVYPVVVGYDEADPCNKEKYKVEASKNINLTSNYFDYNNLPDQKWYQTDKSFLKSLSYSDNLSFETLMDGQDKNVSAFVFGDKYCSVDNISSDKLSLYEVGVMTVSVKGFNWDGDYEGWFVNKSKILDERVYHYIAKLPCQNDKIFTAKVVGKGVIVIDDNYVDADSKPKDYHCGLAIPHCSDDEPGPTPDPDIVPKTVTEKDECSESDLFKGTASTSKAAKALANEARIKKGECVYGLPKCSKWIKDSNNDKVYHITSSPICGGNNSDDVVDLFTVTLNKAGVPEKGSRVMNNEVAMNNLYKVFSYECGVDSMLVEDTIPAHVGKAIMVSADQYFAKYALRIFVKVSYDWEKNRASYSSADNQDLNQAFNDLVTNWLKKNVSPNPIDYALNRPTGSLNAGPKHLMNIIENSSYSSQLEKNIRSNLKAGNRQIDFCNLCSAFRNIYRIVALSFAEIPYSYKDVEFMYDYTKQIPSKYSSPISEYRYIYNGLFVTTLDKNPSAASSGINRSIYYTQAEADEKNKEILNNIENALSVCLATIYDDVHKAASSTMSVNGKSFQYMPNNLSVKSVPNIAVQVDGTSCNK